MKETVCTKEEFEDRFGIKITESSKIFRISKLSEYEYTLVLENNTKLSECLDRLPCGIINKTITGIGATTLEITSQKRNSIIVVPTKSLAYNKVVACNKKLEGDFAFYVGSSIGEVKSLSDNDIKDYLNNHNIKCKKILVVADSLPRLINIFIEEKIDYTSDYFLMIDEVDTMQVDSVYRDNLEKILDYYFEFASKNRCMVSATLNDFSDERMQKEIKLKIDYSKKVKRNINLVHTNYTDYCAYEVIKHLQEKHSKKKILVAYNSIDGIVNIVLLLAKPKEQYGILCSERSFDKISKLNGNTSTLDYENALQNDGTLKHQVTFMTCAFFAGIDINEDCHIVTISSHKQLFTVLSPNRMKQIAGRCRTNILSETIIYDDKSADSRNTLNYDDKSMEDIITKAKRICKLLNEVLELSREDADFSNIYNRLKRFFYYKSEEKSTQKDSVRTIRLNSRTRVFVPAYFNIDALAVQKGIIKLYEKKEALKEILEADNNVTFKERTYENSEIIRNPIDKVKKLNKEMREEYIGAIREICINSSCLDLNIRECEILKISDKKIQMLISFFIKYNKYVDAELLFDCLAERIEDYGKTRNFINAVVFHILPNDHPFKSLVKAKFNIDSGESLRLIPEKRTKLIQEAWEAMTSITNLSDRFFANLYSSFFESKRNDGKYIVNGLNPLGIKSLRELPNDVDVLEYFILPN